MLNPRSVPMLRKLDTPVVTNQGAKVASETIIIGTLQAVAAVALAIGAILLKIIRDDQKELRDTLASHVEDSRSVIEMVIRHDERLNRLRKMKRWLRRG